MELRFREPRRVWQAGSGTHPRATYVHARCLDKQVLKVVERVFESHPGKLEHFDWPVTPAQAETALQDFLDNRLPLFGEYQDAMWTSQPFLYHARISAALNLKLIHPKRVVEQAEQRYRQGHASLAAVEGFIRQVLGWREYVRGLYWLHMPGYVKMNELDAREPLPQFYWTGETDMQYLQIHHMGQKHAMGQIVTGYDKKAGPAIALPDKEHQAIDNLKGQVTATPRDHIAQGGTAAQVSH